MIRIPSPPPLTAPCTDCMSLHCLKHMTTDALIASLRQGLFHLREQARALVDAKAITHGERVSLERRLTGLV